MSYNNAKKDHEECLIFVLLIYIYNKLINIDTSTCFKFAADKNKDVDNTNPLNDNILFQSSVVSFQLYSCAYDLSKKKKEDIKKKKKKKKRIILLV